MLERRDDRKMGPLQRQLSSALQLVKAGCKTSQLLARAVVVLLQRPAGPGNPKKVYLRRRQELTMQVQCFASLCFLTRLGDCRRKSAGSAT